MTESEWLAGTDPLPMLDGLAGNASDRKLRLFAVACCRRIWPLIEFEDRKNEDKRCGKAVEAAERYADGMATREGLAVLSARPRPALYAAQAAFETAEYIPMSIRGASQIACVAAETEAMWRSSDLGEAGELPDGSNPALGGGDEVESYTGGKAEAIWPVVERLQAELVRCVFGNPFRPVPLDRTTLTPEILDLARVIYEERAFDRMPSLADALEAAGCHEADVLAHCRSGGKHARGCWVVDRLLDRR